MIPKVGQVWNYKGSSQYAGYKPDRVEITLVSDRARYVRVKDISITNHLSVHAVYLNRFTFAELISVYELDPVYKALEDFDSQLEELVDGT